MFWLFFAVLMAIGGLASLWTDAGVIAGIIISAWVVGFIAESSGASSGIWLFASPAQATNVVQAGHTAVVSQASPPIYLILGCWPLEILAQFALSALISGESLVPGSESPGSGSHGKTAGRAPESNNPGPAKGASETDTEVDAGRQQGKDSDNEKSTRPDCRLQRSSHQEGSLITESELDDLTDEERTLKAFMLFSCVIYFVAGLAYAVKPGFVIYVLQDISRFFDHPTSYHDVSDRFWVSMSFSMMMTISFLAFYAHYNIRTNKNYIIPLLIAKASSTVSALVYFIFVKRYQPCLAVVFVDGMLFWITLHLYIQANKGFLDTHTTYCEKSLKE